MAAKRKAVASPAQPKPKPAAKKSKTAANQGKMTDFLSGDTKNLVWRTTTKNFCVLVPPYRPPSSHPTPPSSSRPSPRSSTRPSSSSRPSSASRPGSSTRPAASPRRQSGRIRTQVALVADSDTSDADVPRTVTGKKKLKKKIDSDDDDFVMPEADAADDDDDDEEEEAAEEDSDAAVSEPDDEELATDSDIEVKPKKGRGKAKAAVKTEVPDNDDKTDVDDEDDDAIVSDSDGGDSKAKAKKGEKKKYTDGWKFKAGLDSKLPPISDVQDIADDMTEKAWKKGLEKVLSHLGDRKLRVATMCSGTESPILAMQLFSDSLKKQHGVDFEYEHLFSGEIVPFKQAYIERNFQPPIMFRDIKELHQETATTAYGAEVRVPGEVDMLIAGFSCVDYSNLNVRKPLKTDPGESVDSLGAIMHYAKIWKPPIMILENVLGAPWQHIIEWVGSLGNNYHAQWVRVDTKDYYVPQTRVRGYAICISKDAMKGGKDAVGEWKEMMQEFKRPVSSPVEAFILPEDDPRIKRGRVDLAKGARGDEKTARAVDWVRCQGRHADYRQDLELGVGRPFTSWEEGGSCKMPDYTWHDWNKVQVERIWDTLDGSLLRAARRGFDMQYKSRVIELSQNIDRFTDTTPSGISGCITPTGAPYLTSRGGLIIGLESLSLQGLPIERLLLTRETQAQLQDLAGNAMSTTVVGTAILSALLVAFKALPAGNTDSKKNAIAAPDVSGRTAESDQLVAKSMNLGTYKPTPVDELLELSARSFRKCLCEGRDGRTKAAIKECRDCGHTACDKCAGKPTHNYKQMTSKEQAKRLAPMDFEAKIKEAIPMRLSIDGFDVSVIEDTRDRVKVKVSDGDWKILIAAIRASQGQELRFHSLRRSHSWTVVYDSPTTRLELELRARYAEWRLYGKPGRQEAVQSRVRTLLKQPFARMRPRGDDICVGLWEVCLPTSFNFDIQLEGHGDLWKAWESELGLTETEFAEKTVWSDLKVTIDDAAKQKLDLDISGNYKHIKACGTASDSLHKKTDSSAAPGGEIFLFLDPTLYDDPKFDQFVFSTDCSRQGYGDSRPIICRVDHGWRPSNADKNKTIKAKLEGQWIKYPAGSIEPLTDLPEVIARTPSDGLSLPIVPDACATASTILHCEVPLTDLETVGWREGPWQELANADARVVFAAFAWLTERVRDMEGIKDWTSPQRPEPRPVCEHCFPKMPAIRWTVNKKKWQPFEDPQEAAPYERALKDRPQPFVTQTRIDENQRGLLRIGLNPTSLCHRALALLPITDAHDDAHDDTFVQWRLTSNFNSEERVTRPEFKLKTNKLDAPSDNPSRFKLKLRPEQLRSLAWMKYQDGDEAPAFDEEEIEEALLPQLGWRAEGRAQTSINVKGGVLADQVGYGKTAITLGLIASTQDEAAKLVEQNCTGRIPVKATLILTPDTICHQWKSEVEKFCGTGYVVEVISSIAEFQRMSIARVQKADIIIVQWKLLSHEAYLESVARFAALPPMPQNKGRAFDAWLDTAMTRMAQHLEILRDEGAEHLSKHQETVFNSFIEDEGSNRFVPSKRYRGAEYRKRENAKKEAAKQEKARPKTKDEKDDYLLPGEQDPEVQMRKKGNNAGGAAAAKKARVDLDAVLKENAEWDQITEAETQRFLNSGKHFGLTSAAVKRDWQNMTTPLLQLFRFNRLVVDEYTYIQGQQHTCVLSLNARARWILSGTPPLGDFVDIKSIAVFLGIHLGIDDDSVGAISGANIKALQKERTAAEHFQSFRQTRSSAWHDARHRTAQRFLDQFVRQNVAEIDEIPFAEVIHGVELPSAERALYMELEHFLRTQDMKIRKGQSNHERNDRQRRLKEALAGAGSAEEALLRRSSHFSLDAYAKKSHSAAEACAAIEATRTSELAELMLELSNNLALAFAYKAAVGKRDAHFARWLEHMTGPSIGDPEASAAMKGAIESAKSATVPGATSVPWQPSGKLKKLVSGTDTKVAELRNLATNTLRRLCAELVNRHRSLRFFGSVRAIMALGSEEGIDTSQPVLCSSCGKPAESPAALYLLETCGHTLCFGCGGTACGVAGCLASASNWRPVVGATLIPSADSSGDATLGFGRKLDLLVQLLRTGIPEDEQVLLFVQYPELQAAVENILSKAGVKYLSCAPSDTKPGKKVTISSAASKAMSSFQTDTNPQTRAKLLILNTADESAAGANLTNANHVVFLAPLLSEGRYRYESSMKQAIGRVRRFGQGRRVLIHRLLATGTVDERIVEEREGKRLERVGGAWGLVEGEKKVQEEDEDEEMEG